MKRYMNGASQCFAKVATLITLEKTKFSPPPVNEVSFLCLKYFKFRINTVRLAQSKLSLNSAANNVYFSLFVTFNVITAK